MTDVAQQLHARDLQVAELIDEIVFLESSHAAAEKALRAEMGFASQLAENALSYAVVLEQAVVVPAVGSIDNFLGQASAARGAGLARQSLVSATNAAPPSAHTPAVASETLRQLMDRFRSGPDYGQAKQRREQMMQALAARMQLPGSNVTLEVEDALVLIECLLEQQQQLGVLLADSSKRLFDKSAAAAGGGGNKTGDSAAATAAHADELDRKGAEIALLSSQLKHLEQLSASQASKLQVADEEISRLSKAARSSGAIEELQKHFQHQEERYLRKIDQCERDAESRLQERLAEAARIESLQKIIEDASEERHVMRGEMDRLRGLAVASNSAAAGGGGGGFFFRDGHRSGSGGGGVGGAGVSSGEHSLRMELERNIREHSTVVTQLEGEIASLRSELVHAQHDAAGAAAQRSHLEQLHRNNELLRLEIGQLQQRIHSHESTGAQREAEAEKVAMMESTILQLGDEVGAVDARIRSMHAQHLAERERLGQLLERERARFQLERDECDALVWRMTSELEYLVKDNALLKAKLDGMEDDGY